MKDAKLLISVSSDDITDVRVFLVDAKTGKQQELQPGVNYTVEFVQKRTERCKVCDRTYPASEIVARDGESLCVQVLFQSRRFLPVVRTEEDALVSYLQNLGLLMRGTR